MEVISNMMKIRINLNFRKILVQDVDNHISINLANLILKDVHIQLQQHSLNLLSRELNSKSNYEN